MESESQKESTSKKILNKTNPQITVFYINQPVQYIDSKNNTSKIEKKEIKFVNGKQDLLNNSVVNHFHSQPRLAPSAQPVNYYLGNYQSIKRQKDQFQGLNISHQKQNKVLNVVKPESSHVIDKYRDGKEKDSQIVFLQHEVARLKEKIIRVQEWKFIEVYEFIKQQKKSQKGIYLTHTFVQNMFKSFLVQSSQSTQKEKNIEQIKKKQHQFQTFLENSFDQIRKRYPNYQQECDDRSAKLKLSSLKQDLCKLQQKLTETEQRYFSLIKILDHSKLKVNENQQLIKQFQQTVDNKDVQIENLKTKIHDQDTKIKNIQISNQNQSQKLNYHLKEVQKLNIEKSRLKATLHQLNDTVYSIQTENQTLVKINVQVQQNLKLYQQKYSEATDKLKKLQENMKDKIEKINHQHQVELQQSKQENQALQEQVRQLTQPITKELLKNSSVILKKKIKHLKFVNELVENQTKHKIVSTSLLYRKNMGSKDLTKNIAKVFAPSGSSPLNAFLLLFRSILGNEFGIFCWKNDKIHQTLLINLKTMEVFGRKEGTTRKAYSEKRGGAIIEFGAEEIRIQNQEPSTLSLDFDVMGERYFEIDRESYFTNENGGKIRIQEVELHSVIFQTEKCD